MDHVSNTLFNTHFSKCSFLLTEIQMEEIALKKYVSENILQTFMINLLLLEFFLYLILMYLLVINQDGQTLL